MHGISVGFDELALSHKGREYLFLFPCSAKVEYEDDLNFLTSPEQKYRAFTLSYLSHNLKTSSIYGTPIPLINQNSIGMAQVGVNSRNT